ncbi:ATP-binding protein [Flavobacterium sp.]|uniref:tetratricopeptide repeat-containing hybrid sensor histidine kinase/response regulator n=1 Tax=Flavobacterium sp. TaxID=239 RepID=UPI003750AE70
MNINVLSEKNKVIQLLEDSYSGRINNLPKSIETAEIALQISRNIGDKSLIGKSLNQLSLYFMIISDFDQSNKKSEEAIVYFTQLNDDIGIADAKYNIGSVYYKTNNYHAGLVYLIDALKLYKKNNDLYNQSKVEKAIGTIYEYIGDSYNAFKSYKSSIKVAKKIGEYNLESNVYNNLSGLLLKREKTKIAMNMIEYSIMLKRKTNDIRGYAFAIYGRGKIYLKNDDLENAESDFLEAVVTHRKMGENMGAAMCLNKLGVLYLKLDLYDKAQEKAQEGLELTIRHNMSMIKIKNYHLLYLIFKKSNDNIKSLEYLECYLKEKESVINTQTLKVIENYDLINKMNVLESEALLQKEKQIAIEKKNRDEEESVRLKQEFLSIMSHEIRTPLNAITTIVSILDNQINGESKKLLKSLQFASDNLISIVNDILDFTKLDSNKAKLEKHNINLSQLCDNILNLHSGLANNKNLNLNLITNLKSDQNYLLDKTKLSQILSNLISNAIKFTDYGKVDFIVELLKEENEFDTIIFKVIDTGEGISESDMLEIFVSFSQIKPIMTRKQGGTGLGLAIVKKLVELHNSEIRVKSKEKVGSEFYFEIKIRKVSQEIITTKTNAYQLKDKIALLAEDTPMNALLMKKLLSNWGVITDHAKNGKEAFELAKQKKYDFILMDIHMPEMNGFEATTLIRSNKNLNNNTPIFAVTADVMTKEDKENAHLFNGILWKPLEIEKLFSALTKEVEVKE